MFNELNLGMVDSHQFLIDWLMAQLQRVLNSHKFQIECLMGELVSTEFLIDWLMELNLGC